MKVNKLYKIYIYEKYIELKNSEKILDNYDLAKIFEWFSCIYLYQQYNKPFYEYSDIDPTFKEMNNMTKNDTGIDCCDMIDTIVQCKLRKDTLDWKECGTFFGSQNIYSEELNKIIVRWNNLIITRNEECKLSKNLLEKSKLFTDIAFPRKDIIDYCENLLANPPKYPKTLNQEFELRDYQVEAINIIRKNNQNIIVSLPTGCGKNVVMIYSFKKNKKYLILVPRIILMEQLQDEIIRHKPELKNTIQCIGGSNNDYDETKNICICVYNSVSLIEPYFESFNKIYIDEAHHIDKPIIYTNDEEDILDEDLNDEEVYSDYDSDEEEKVLELVDDKEDEIKETTGYHNIIKTLSKYNNNVYLSATIDMIQDFAYYKKDIRDMIEEKYLCDYNIHIPIFSDDPSNKNICEHLIANYMNIIIYCNSQKEGKSINTLMNTLQKGCSEYIDCMTSKTKRNNIIKKYKEGLIPFLVNVRILVEGFDAPITKGICFMHLPSSKTTLIQIIGRALRLHPLKTIAHIILPFSCKEDEGNINNFLKVMANNDKRIKKSYENKKLGGYISIENTIEDVEEENTAFEFRYNMIFDNMGKLLNGMEIWMKQLEEVKDYIDKNEKTPKKDSKNIIIKNLGIWISTQKYTYRLNKMIKIRIPIWETFIKDYNKYFISFGDNWLLKYNNFIKDNDNDKYIDWFNNQKQNYKKQRGFYKNTILKQKWDNLIEQYPKLFENYDEKWNNTLLWIDNYISLNNQRPDKIKNKDEYRWLIGIGVDYKKRRHLLKHDIYRQKWELFTNKYPKIFTNIDTIWIHNYNKLYNYIKDNNVFPNSKEENTKNLAKWYHHQKDKIKEYKLSEDKILLMNNLKEKFPDVMKTEFDIWKDVLLTIINFINVHNKLPTANKNNEFKFKLAMWINNQKRNYKNNDRNMKNIEFKQKWTEFINDPKYKKYFITDTNIDDIDV